MPAIDAAEIKRQVKSHQEQYRRLYQPFEDHDRHENWADDIDIRATSRVFSINIVVVRGDGADPNVFRQRNASATVVLGYTVASHYQPIFRDEQMLPRFDLMQFVNRSDYDDEWNRILHGKSTYYFIYNVAHK